MMSSPSFQVAVSEEVSNALTEGRPVVALESTIITHGMPYPDNVRVAHEVERVVRENGAVPATVGILAGVPIVGLTAEQIDDLGRKGHAVTKCSRRDLPYIMTKKLDGATTVAATMMVAARAGVCVFATGGVGGVHRGAERTWDVSADLREFTRSPVIVVSAGAKAILDLPKTLEYFETEGVLTLGYRTDEFPAFYTSTSGLKISHRADNPREIAQMWMYQRQVDMRYGMFVANPIPKEREVDGTIIETAIQRALADAEAQHIVGKDTTPFLLQRVAELTNHDSLTANIALVKNNATLAAQIASEIASLKSS
eukprot:gnl/Trimastix_PCT/2083.p1 GENE.gnl/Trimastix_PCT/2083~~gnl/Trimastix_PCT/2083.p1  ORF type:complete len:312 (+),score=92.16 gnl/Trimastix_PCT/2083:52-987(+)